MGTEIFSASLKDEDLEFPALPPGFESFMSFKLKKVEDTENEPSCSASSNISNQEPVNVKPEPNHSSEEKNSWSLRHRSGVNYGRSNQFIDEDFDSKLPYQAMKTDLPKGVIRGCADCQNCQKVIARWHPEASHRPELEDVPVFHPSEEEFKDTIKYIEQLRLKAEKYGICRIVPPPSWKPPCSLKEKDIWDSSKFVTRVQRVDKLQKRDASRKMSKVLSNARKKRRKSSKIEVDCAIGSGKYLEKGEGGFGFEPGPDFTLEGFQRYADEFKAQYFRTENCADSGLHTVNSTENWNPSIEMIEGEYWRVVEKPTEEIEVMYGADLETGVFGSGFPKPSDQGCSYADEEYVKSGWNLNNLPRLPGSVLSYENADISGVQVPWLYVGMCFSSFCWHVEDHHLYSLNYMHFGAPKLWYGVPGSDATKLEHAMKKHLPDLFDEQPDLLHKLVTQLSPSILKSEGVPVYRCVQNPGEFVLTFPRAYHAGFNCGFNCAEAVNVAPVDWFPHGQNAVELYREQGRKTTISHDKLLLGAAREAVKANWELNLLRKNTVDNLRWKDVTGKDGILAKSFRARVETENSRREYLCKYARALKMESNFDSTTERECIICFFDLHLSACGCRCSPARFTCLNHAKLLCSCDWDRKFFLFRYDIAELNLLVDALEGKLSAIYRWARLDLGLALSSCTSKDSLQITGMTGAYSEHPVETKTNSQPLVTSKDKDNMSNIPTNATSNVSKIPSGQKAHFPEIILGLEATRVPPIKLCLNVKRKSDKPQSTNDQLEFPAYNATNPEPQFIERDTTTCSKRSTALESQMKLSPARHDDLICLSDEENELLNKPVFDARKESTLQECLDVPQVVQVSDHKLNLCDLANAALAAEANSSLMFDGQKDDCMSCSTSPKDEKEKCEPVGVSDEQNLSRHQGSMGSRVEKRDRDASTPDSCGQNLACVSGVRHVIKFRDECLVHRRDLKQLDDARAFPGSPSCSQSSVDKYPRHKGPRIAKVVRRINSHVELLEIGVAIPGYSWSSSRAIFPKGFKSCVRYINILDPTNMCTYISEILDGGSKGPLFMVSLEDSENEVFVQVSPTRCWEMVREKVNQEITKQHKLGRMQLPPLQPPGSLDGFEMFGFTSPTIVQGIEALDKNRVCTEYWRSRPLAQFAHCFQSKTNSLRLGPMPEAANEASSTLRGLFKKAKPEELQSLMETLGNSSSLVTRLLNEEIQNRTR